MPECVESVMPLAYTLACSSCAPGPTDPVPRGLLTLWARADVCMHVCMYVYTRTRDLWARAGVYACM